MLGRYLKLFLKNISKTLKPNPRVEVHSLAAHYVVNIQYIS